MAVRSLTDAFILLRNNAIQSKNVFSRQHSDFDDEDDTVALVGSKYNKQTKASYSKSTFSLEWTNLSHDIQYDMSKIEEKIQELASMHDRHLTRPTLDDTSDEEQGIEICTQEISQLFHKCNDVIKKVAKYQQRCNDQERVMLKNAVSSYATLLQQLSVDFRKQQSSYVKKLKAREERSHQYFNSNTAIMVEEDDISDDFFEKGFSSNQVAVIQRNTVNIEQREEEIRSVVQSITDLADIFKDLSQIVVEQGTVLDQIDYNIEQTVVKTEAGLQQLQKAETYQKKNRKMLIIVVLSIIATILLIVVIATRAK